MKDKILEPDTLENPLPVNYEKLANALRQDMRDASEQLVIIKQILFASQDGQIDVSKSTIENVAIDMIDSALLYLDCTEAIKDLGRNAPY